MKYIGLILIMTIICSCQKEESPITRSTNSAVETGYAPLTQDYRYQLYYKLETNTVVGKNLKTDWDLAFTTSATNYRIKSNVANGMSVANLGDVTFSSITDTSNFGQFEKFDAVTGNIDSTAIGDWRAAPSVYIVNRGFSFTGQHRGYYKLKIHSYTDYSYTIEVAEISDVSGALITINKLDDYNFSFFSFDTNEQLMIEPPKNEWDLTFSQYTHIFFEPDPLPYLVTGALLNEFETTAIQFNDLPFEDIELMDVMNLELSENNNTLGYDWKTFEDGNYTIHVDKTYIIKDQNGFFYKLRFIDFYDLNGQRGTPTWEFQKL